MRKRHSLKVFSSARTVKELQSAIAIPVNDDDDDCDHYDHASDHVGDHGDDAGDGGDGDGDHAASH